MDNNYDEQFIIMKAEIEANKQEMKSNKKYYDVKMMKLTEDFKEMLTEIKDKINNLKSSPTKKDLPSTPDPIAMVTDNRRSTKLDSGQS